MTTPYVIEIVSWNWSYSLSINTGEIHDGPMDEYRHLEIQGVLRTPEIPAAKTVDIVLLPQAEMGHFEAKKGSFTRIGGIFLQDGALKVYQAIPQDVLPSILTMLIAGRFKTVVITGSFSLTHEAGEVYGLRLSQKTHDAEKLP